MFRVRQTSRGQVVPDSFKGGKRNGRTRSGPENPPYPGGIADGTDYFGAMPADEPGGTSMPTLHATTVAAGRLAGVRAWKKDRGTGRSGNSGCEVYAGVAKRATKGVGLKPDPHHFVIFARCATSTSWYFHGCSQYTCFKYPRIHGCTSVFS